MKQLLPVDDNDDYFGESEQTIFSRFYLKQITFLAELDQLEIVKVLHDGLIIIIVIIIMMINNEQQQQQRNPSNIGHWLYCLLTLLDPIQIDNVYYELRLLFQTLNRQRKKILFITMERIRNNRKNSSNHQQVMDNGHEAQQQQQQQPKNDDNRKQWWPKQQQQQQQQQIYRPLKDQYCNICLIMMIIIHFFGQKDLLDSLI
ncbi:hypothetical protein DERP_006225 [Dermatophagoides pteronyssinus]|uniref:Uncharacterized protein n=1 Tax=Dermatophagoides pteronyssinus TaxID=6956 RepID=A0ABQ8IY64_DERPT|nr:hypothetical protein DERP_006225 [Dermatophagoides pteronyssinus]